jgi:5-methyltetrahydropteroyltriglutamate--homocysteine methyltransferase
MCEKYLTLPVILGVLEMAKTRIESIEEIESRLLDAMEHIEKDRLIAAPDCGLGMLSQETILAKLSHLSQAVEKIG